jgi:hypothetical protein
MNAKAGKNADGKHSQWHRAKAKILPAFSMLRNSMTTETHNYGSKD